MSPAPTVRPTLRSASLLALALFLLASLAAADIRRSFDTGAGGELRVDVGGASVDIRTSEGSSVDVEIERKRSGDPIEEDFDVRIEQVGSDVEIEIEKKGQNWGWKDGLEVTVTVPRRFDVDVSTSGGSLSVEDLEGDVDARTSGGSVSLGAIRGEVVARTSGGSIRLASSTVTADLSTSGGSITIGDVGGAIRARTSGGSISVERADGEVDVSTSGGSITLGDIGGAIQASTSGGSVRARFAAQPSSGSRISTSGGTIRVTIAEGVGFDLEAEASSGVTTDVPIEVRGRIERTRVAGKVNGGGPELVLRASGGRVVLEEN